MDTTTFEITTTVEDADAPAAKAALQSILEQVKARVTGVFVREVTLEPAAEERSRPFHASVLRIN